MQRVTVIIIGALILIYLSALESVGQTLGDYLITSDINDLLPQRIQRPVMDQGC